MFPSIRRALTPARRAALRAVAASGERASRMPVRISGLAAPAPGPGWLARVTAPTSWWTGASNSGRTLDILERTRRTANAVSMRKRARPMGRQIRRGRPARRTMPCPTARRSGRRRADARAGRATAPAPLSPRAWCRRGPRLATAGRRARLRRLRGCAAVRARLDMPVHRRKRSRLRACRPARGLCLAHDLAAGRRRGADARAGRAPPAPLSPRASRRGRRGPRAALQDGAGSILHPRSQAAGARPRWRGRAVIAAGSRAGRPDAKTGADGRIPDALTADYWPHPLTAAGRETVPAVVPPGATLADLVGDMLPGIELDASIDGRACRARPGRARGSARGRS